MLLLFDLDGVLVTDGKGDTRAGREIVRIHPDLDALLQPFDFPVGVLSHRSRREVLQILDVLQLGSLDPAFIFSANDIAFSSPTPRRIVSLVRHGVRKSRILAHLSSRFGIESHNVAFVDDREENVADMSMAGVGLAVHVPAARLENGRVLTYAPEELVKAIGAWIDTSPRTKRRVALGRHELPVNPQMFSGVRMEDRNGELFARIRRLRRRLPYIGS